MIKKRNIVVVLLIVIMIISSVSVAQQAEVKVSIDGEYVDFNDTTGYPFIDNNNRIQVPFRATLKAVGADVSWQNETKKAVAKKNDTKIEVFIGQQYILKNGIRIMNDTAAVIKDDRTFLPIRIVMESLGYDVTWNNQEKIVLIQNRELEKEEQKIEKPEVKIEAPSKTKDKEVTIKIITDKDHLVYLNKKKIELDNNNEYIVELSDSKNKFQVEIINNEGMKTLKTFTIERISEDLYLNVEPKNVRVKKDHITISGQTNKENKVKVNGNKVTLDSKGEFEYCFTDLQPGENTILVSCKNTELDKEIEKEISVFYDAQQSNENFQQEKQEDDEFYFKLDHVDKKVDHKWINISGDTNKSSKVKLNGDNMILSDKGHFEYYFTDLQPGENTILVSCENSKFDEKVEKRIIVFYEGSQSEDDSENEEESVEKFTENIHGNEDSEYEEPVIKIDNEIPKITDKLSLTISGTVENADYIVVNGGATSTSGRMKLNGDNKFSHTIELYNGENGGQQTKNGIYNFIQIYAVNNHKVTGIEYKIYYKK